MTKILFGTLAFMVVLGHSNLTLGQPPQTIALWTFEPDPLAVNLTNNTIGPSILPPAGGSGSLIGTHASSATVWSTPSGNGSSNALSVNTWAVGDYWQFLISTTNYTSINMSWDQTRSSTGVTNFTVRYSLDGTSFTSFTNYSVNAVTWNSTTATNTSSFSYSFSSVPLLENQTSVYFRLVGEQTPAASGTGRIDNVLFTGVIPEPSSAMLFGLGALAYIGMRAMGRKQS